MACVRFCATIKKNGKAESKEVGDNPDLKQRGGKKGIESNSENTKGIAQIFMNLTYAKGIRFRY